MNFVSIPEKLGTVKNLLLNSWGALSIDCDYEICLGFQNWKIGTSID